MKSEKGRECVTKKREIVTKSPLRRKKCVTKQVM
jgi:hypothetical protein